MAEGLDLSISRLFQATTLNGNLRLTLDQRPKNNLDYVGASMQSWNKLCVLFPSA